MRFKFTSEGLVEGVISRHAIFSSFAPAPVPFDQGRADCPGATSARAQGPSQWSRVPGAGFGLRAHSSAAFPASQCVPGCQLTAVLLGLRF